MADGHLNVCKDCKKSASKDIRDNNPEYYREYDRQRSVTSQRRESLELYAKGKGKSAAKAAKEKYIANNGKKRRAHNAVSNALRDGKLTRKSCEVCGEVKTNGHHDDYDKPLDVRWLCDTHHNLWHKLNGPGKNGY